MSTTMVHVRVDEKTKERAAKTLAAMGISVSDAVRMLLVRVAAEKALPFEVRVPNATTVKAMRAADRAKGERHRSASALLKELDLIVADPDQRCPIPPRCEVGAEARQGHSEIAGVSFCCWSRGGHCQPDTRITRSAANGATSAIAISNRTGC